MSIRKRRYKLYADFHRVFKFLQDTYDMESLNSYLLPQFFEYAHTHPAFNHKLTHRFGLWEDDGELCGIACYEMDLGETLISVHPDYEFCLPDMLCWAERELSTFNDGVRKHAVWITDKEKTKCDLLVENSYHCIHSEPVTIFTYAKEFPEVKLPDGFSIITLADETIYEKSMIVCGRALTMETTLMMTSIVVCKCNPERTLPPN